MDTRREFIRKAMLLSSAAGWNGLMPESIRKALAVQPAPGSTYLDAEHVVVLMQENRSFDHCFGTLKGVRGFNDPRYIHLPDGNPVWLQRNKAGATHIPFRFDIRDTRITWMGSVPHSRSSQVDASNGGRHDQWLDSKRPHNKEYAEMPLTLGHYTREDLPFNYALADAFTVCDQHFCSGMTSTWPNRLFLWSGTVRGEQNGNAKAFIRNDIPYGEAGWVTFPELLEKNEVSWKVYQNDITEAGDLTAEESAWLSNFGCNQLESFTQYHVRFSPGWIRKLEKEKELLSKELTNLRAQLNLLSDGNEKEKLQEQAAVKTDRLHQAEAELQKWSPENYERLSQESKNLFQKAFTNNAGDPDYHQLTSLSYEENGVSHTLNIPRGDILHQFRQDVNQGQLPAVSWLVGPENFSDHPTAPWYGAWYVSEILDILTQNPEVWKKTIFILTYDENDGYFDHVPPFVAPDPLDANTGKCSAGIDTAVEYIRREQELKEGVDGREARSGPTGLGFRVPMIIASPWTRGGQVCSQVFDHSSVFRFIQDWLKGKTGKQIRENNISDWRKTVSGDLTSAFKPYHGEAPGQLPWIQKVPFIESIFSAQFKKAPANFEALSPGEIASVRKNPSSLSRMPVQEPGIKPSCALPYQLYAEGGLTEDRKQVELVLESRDEFFGARAAGSPFNLYLPGNPAAPRSYAVRAGDRLTDLWPLSFFNHEVYQLCVHGPNGFFREFSGDAADPALRIRCEYEKSSVGKPSGNLLLKFSNTNTHHSYQLEISDNAYKGLPLEKTISSLAAASIVLDQSRSFGWYDINITVRGFPHFSRRYAGRIETGRDSFTDPFMGNAI